MSKEDKQKIVNEKFFGTTNNIFNLKEVDFANKESMPFYDVIIYILTTLSNQLKIECPKINDMVIFCKDNNSNQLSDDWKNKWLSMTDDQKNQIINQCKMDFTQAKEMCDKKDSNEYSMEIFRNIFDVEDLKNINKILLESDVDIYIDNSGKINDKNKVFQNALEYAANSSTMFKNSLPVQKLTLLFGKEVNVNTVIYFAENFFKVANEVTNAKKLQKGGKIGGGNAELEEILNEIKNRYIKHISDLKSKTANLVNNLQDIKVKDFESESFAPYYNEVKNMGGSYSFGLLTTFLLPQEITQLMNTLKNDMNENPEDYFNLEGKLIDKKRKLINHINIVLNKSNHAKQQFKEYFKLMSEPTLEQALSILKECNANMSNDDRVAVAKKLEIEQSLKKATLSMTKSGGTINKKRLQSIRKIMRKQALRRIISKHIQKI